MSGKIIIINYIYFLAGELVKLEGVTVIYIISDKKTMPTDHEKFYNIVAAYTLERILKYAEELNTKDGKISGYGIKAISLDNNPKSFKWWIKGWE